MKVIRSFISRIYIFLGSGMLLAYASCSRDTMVPAVDFDVLVESRTVSVGEPVLFQFTGTADLVTFYSGEPGSEYQYRDRVIADGQPLLEFSSTQQNMTNGQTLQLMVSKDFTGVYDEENLRKATWTDITSRATLSGSSAVTPSGTIDLSDIGSGSDPIFIGFRYTAETADMIQPTWTITNVFISNRLDDGSTVSVASLANLSWGTVNVAGTQAWTYNASQVRIAGGGAGADANEDWVITQPLQLNRVQRAYGINVKGNPIAKQLGYEYTFGSAGTYVATFEAMNVNRWGQESKVIEITITVQ